MIHPCPFWSAVACRTSRDRLQRGTISGSLECCRMHHTCLYSPLAPRCNSGSLRTHVDQWHQLSFSHACLIYPALPVCESSQGLSSTVLFLWHWRNQERYQEFRLWTTTHEDKNNIITHLSLGIAVGHFILGGAVCTNMCGELHITSLIFDLLRLLFWFWFLI